MLGLKGRKDIAGGKAPWNFTPGYVLSALRACCRAKRNLGFKGNNYLPDARYLTPEYEPAVLASSIFLSF